MCVQWTWIGLTDCKGDGIISNCEDGFYRYKESSAYKQTNKYKLIKVCLFLRLLITKIQYGSGMADGYRSTDWVYFDEGGYIGG